MDDLKQKFLGTLKEFQDKLKDSKFIVGFREPDPEMRYFEQEEGNSIHFRNFKMDETEKKKAVKLESPYGTEFRENFNSVYNSIQKHIDRVIAKLNVSNGQITELKNNGLEAKDLDITIYKDVFSDKSPNSKIVSYNLYISNLGEFKDRFLRVNYTEVIETKQTIDEGSKESVEAYGFLLKHYNITPDGETSRVYSSVDAFTATTDLTTLIDKPYLVLREETLKELTNKEV